MILRWRETGRISADILRGDEFMHKAVQDPQEALKMVQGYDALVGGVDLAVRPGPFADP